MCGICGFLNINGPECSVKILEEMNSAIIHRGPDGKGLYIHRNAAIGHRRLSIIDLSKAGSQPMLNKDKSLTISFNGEIYNYLELRRGLESDGYKFNSNTDTEVILYLFEKYGNSCVEKLNGMFAFAIYNSRTRKFFLARDRFGQKPLFYFFLKKGNDTIFAFASELNALARHPSMPKELDHQAIHDFLSLQYINAPDTIYKQVKKLVPGHYLEVSEVSASYRLEKYWSIKFSESDKSAISYKEASCQLRELVVDSVKKRLMSDVPLGAFLSGGVDSTIIVAIMRKILKIPVKTFTISFKEKNYDESSYALECSNFLGTEHFVKTVNPCNFGLLQKIVLQAGEPFGDSSIIPTYLLSNYTGEKVKVALSGDGADEIFVGYYRYLIMRIAQKFDICPYPIRKALFSLIHPFLPGNNDERTKIGKLKRVLKIFASEQEERYLNLINRFSEHSKHRIYGSALKGISLSPTQEIFNFLDSNSSADNYIEKIVEKEIHSYLPGDILVKVDIASMANSLEVRSPYMDHELGQFAASLPLHFKQNGNQRKRILKDAFSDIVPDSVLSRKKMGFGVPIAKWLRENWKKETEELLYYGKGVKLGFFNKDRVEELFKRHCSGSRDYSYPLWSMLMLEIWLTNNVTTA